MAIFTYVKRYIADTGHFNRKAGYINTDILGLEKLKTVAGLYRRVTADTQRFITHMRHHTSQPLQSRGTKLIILHVMHSYKAFWNFHSKQNVDIQGHN